VATGAEVTYDLTLVVNGVHRGARVPARRTLSDFLRHDLQLTGTHVGCEHGVCGACTVLLDGAPVRSCLTFAVSVDGHGVTTIEGMAGPGTAGSAPELSAVQQAFRECHALQCGFCTPGFMMSIYELLTRQPTPSDEDIVDTLGGHICRCTGYQTIVEAVHLAVEKMRTAK
jgi:carbon-monoxide dehydrogenase small subunit